MTIRPLSAEEAFCLEGTRSYAQYYKMRKGFEEGACAFCQLDRDLNTVLSEDDYAMAWLVPAEYMRAGLAYHALFVPKRHVRFEFELTDEEVLSIHRLKKEIHARFAYKGGNTHVREGDMTLNAGTVPHLHYNTFTPNRTTEVRIPVFKEDKERDANVARAAEFGLLYEAGEVP